MLFVKVICLKNQNLLHTLRVIPIVWITPSDEGTPRNKILVVDPLVCEGAVKLDVRA